MQWIAFCLLSVFFFQNSFALTDTAVRVRIQAGLRRVSLSGLQMQIAGQSDSLRKVALPQTRRLEISRVLIAGKTYWQISQGETAQKSLTSAEPLLVLQGKNLRQDATDLPDKLLLRTNNEGAIDIIGLVPLEDYIASVLAHEMPLSWPLETLKAQAVAIRSYTEALIKERQGRAFHVEASILDQVYRKTYGGKEELWAKAQQAVRETEGVFLLNKKGQFLKAFYHSDCGGRTVLASSVWNTEKDMDAGTAIDAGCPANPKATWTFTIAKEKLQRMIAGDFLALPGNELRRILGFTELKSTNFVVSENNEEVEFKGKGFGHGVGLCQWGSRLLGQQGAGYQRILNHYYPLAALKNL